MKHLQFITHATDRYTDLDEVTDDEVLSVGREAVRLCHHQHATLILDDRVALCPLIGADGVHLGRRDMPVAEARKILGPHAIIGATVNTVEHHHQRASRSPAWPRRLSPPRGCSKRIVCSATPHCHRRYHAR